MRIVLIAGFVGLGLLMGCNLTIYTPPGLVPFKENKLEKLPKNNNYKLYISTLLKDCGYKDLKDTYKCNFYKPLISENLIN